MSGNGADVQWERPWCCPEPRCVPVYQLANRADLATPKPGDTFMCFGRMAEPVEFVYDGEHHRNDLNSCWATALKGVIRNQENASDWRMLAGSYKAAYDAVTGGPQPDNPRKSEGANP